MTEKFSKEAVDFSDGMASRHCGKMFDDDVGYCKYFIGEGTQGAGLCQLVKGEIKRSKWCRKWAKAVTK